MWIPLVVVYVSVVQITITRASCPPGRFGDSCLYSCNCGTSCDQVTGVCPGVCDQGWVKGGELCQKKNVAYNKHASSTTKSNYPNWPPSNAVDGDNDIHGEGRTCFHANLEKPSDWTVDLGREYLLHDIRVYLRYGYNHIIVNSFIYVDNNPSSICYTFPSNVSNIINPTDLVCSTTASYVTIKNPGTSYGSSLMICEVEIYTCVSTYGINCAKRCEDRHCAPGSSCDRYTGLCETGCLPGWIVGDCAEKCDSYHYGMNCSYKCSERNCLPTSTCFHGTGSCDHGCRAGWQGHDCRQECNTGHYGRNCKEMCASRQCIGISACNHITGECIGGCKQEWDGIDCTVQNVQKAPSTALIAGTIASLAFAMLIVLTICIVLWMKRRTVIKTSENVCHNSKVRNDLPMKNSDTTDLYASIDDNEVRGKGRNSVEYEAKSDLPARSVYEDLESESRDHNEDYTNYVNT